MITRATVCRICGAPRYEKGGRALCHTHYLEAKRADKMRRKIYGSQPRKPPATVCRICGAPRYEKSRRMPLCREHYHEYYRNYSHEHKDESNTAMAQRKQELKRAYKGLGLQPGHVWERVRS